MASNVQDEGSKTLGNCETDDFNCNTIYGRICRIQRHLHNKCNVYPSLNNGAQIVSNANVWTLGNYVEVIPKNTITEDFFIHWIVIESVSQNDVFEIVLYAGDAGQENEIGRVRVVRTTVAGSGGSNIPFQHICINANTRISARTASMSGNGNITISLIYHVK